MSKEQNYNTLIILPLILATIIHVLYLRIIFYFYVPELVNEPAFITSSIKTILSELDLSEFSMKLYCLLVIVLATIFYANYKLEAREYKDYTYKLVLAFIIFILPSSWITKFYPPLMILLSLLSFRYLIKYSFKLKTVFLSKKLNIDKFNTFNETFPQEKRFIDTATGLNFEYIFHYLNKKHIGQLNIPNVFRSVWVFGIMGSGKSFIFLISTLKQLLAKKMVVMAYDHKYPSVTSAFEDLHKVTKSPYPLWKICLSDMRYSNRCNPIEPRYIPKLKDIQNAANVVMRNVDEVRNESAFFQGAAEGLFTGNLILVKHFQNEYGMEVCSLPHALILSQVKIKYLVPLLMSHRESLFQSSFIRDAYEETESFDTLAGVTATLQVKLRKLIDLDAFFIMTGKSDFSLELNDVYNSNHLCVGAHEKYSDTLSPFSSLFFEIATKLNNVRKEKNKFVMVIDEFSSLFFKSAEDYLKLGRENECGLVALLQGVNLLSNKYGKEKAAAIIEIMGTLITGQAGAETAKLVSDKIGDITQIKTSLSTDGKPSETTMTGKAVPPSKISNFTQGQFAGVVTDEFHNKIPQKRFNGELLEDKEAHAAIKKNKPLKEIYSFNTSKVQDIISDHIINLEELNFYNYLLTAIENNTTNFLPNEIAFYIKFLEIYDNDFKMIYDEYISLDKKNRSNKSKEEFKSYINNLLQTVILKKEKEQFLTEYMNSLYEQIIYCVSMEYERIKGHKPKDDLFASNDFAFSNFDEIEYQL